MTTSSADAKTPAPDTPRASPFDVLTVRRLIGQIILAVVIVTVIALRFVPKLREPAFGTAGPLLAYLAMIVVVLIRGFMAKLEWRRVLGDVPRMRTFPLLAVVVPLALLTAGSLTLVFVPISYLSPELVEELVLKDAALFDVKTISQLIALCITVVVVAPIVEEFVFRGIIMHRLARRFSTPIGVTGSATLFAMTHVEWVGHFIIGVAFALVYLRTRSLWMSMLTHGLYNALVAAPLAWSFLTHTKDEQTSLTEFRDGLGVGMLTFACGALLLYMYLDLYWKERPVADVMAGETPYDYPASTSAS